MKESDHGPGYPALNVRQFEPTLGGLDVCVWLLASAFAFGDEPVAARDVAGTMCRGKYRVRVAGDDMVGLPRIIEPRAFVTYPAFGGGGTDKGCAFAIVAGVVGAVRSVAASLLDDSANLFEA